MLTNNKICGLLGLATRAGKITFGTDACIGDIEKNKINLVVIAVDASERTKNKFNHLCNTKNIKLFEYLTIDEISHAIGKSNKAVIGIKDVNFANEIEKIINGGEAIG